MGDNLKISRDKRHRSSSSIAGSNIKNTCSERKVNIKVSIPEDDQFALAEARCEDLKEKLDFVKNLKRKRKLRKRSVTRVSESSEVAPYISVQTQPKTRLQSVPRMRCGDTSPPLAHMPFEKPRVTPSQRMQSEIHTGTNVPPYDNCSQEEILQYGVPNVNKRKNIFSRHTLTEAENTKTVSEEGDGTRKGVANYLSPPRINIRSKPKILQDKRYEGKQVRPPANPAPPAPPGMLNRRSIARDIASNEGHSQNEDRSVVELFSKNRSATSNDLKSDSKNCVTNCATYSPGDNETSSAKERENRMRRLKYRSRRYELPTVASQMKQSGMRFYTSDHGSIPFIISKSTAPSHNIAVNLQQVLNGFKNQQPLKGIPLTMAYHMGLGHLPSYVTGNVQPTLENRGMNAIRFGRRLLRLPDKIVSYNRLLSLYREGDGVVSRFLRAINRPHRFYTSMYNLATREEMGASVSPSRHWQRSEDAKRALALYASLYREYQLVERNLKENPKSPELLERKRELTAELAAREEFIRQHVLLNNSEAVPGPNIRASASTADDTYRFSNHKIMLSAKL